MAGLVSPPAFPPHYYLSKLSSTASACFPIVAGSKELASSPGLRSADLAHPHSQIQGQLYCFARARCRALSLHCWRGHRVGRVGSALPLSSLQAWLPCLPHNKISYTVLSRWGAGSCLPCAAAAEGQGLLSHFHDPGGQLWHVTKAFFNHLCTQGI